MYAVDWFDSKSFHEVVGSTVSIPREHSGSPSTPLSLSLSAHAVPGSAVSATTDCVQRKADVVSISHENSYLARFRTQQKKTVHPGDAGVCVYWMALTEFQDEHPNFI